MSISPSSTLAVGTSRLDERARLLGEQILDGTITPNDAACQVLADAVDAGVVRAMCARHHRGLSSVWDVDDITGAVTTMLTAYALGTRGRDGHLDVTRFADGRTSASGWVGKVIGSMRTTRILREMRVDTEALTTSPDELDRVRVRSAEDEALDDRVPDLADHTKGLPSTSASLRIIHASALHEILGLPPLQPWRLTAQQRSDILDLVDRDPSAIRRSLSGEIDDPDERVLALWSGWTGEDLSELLAKSTTIRDIPRLLCEAALKPLPRPNARSGDLAQLRRRVLGHAPHGHHDLLATTLDAFLAAAVEAYTDYDRLRRPLPADQVAQRIESAAQLPALLAEAAIALEIHRLDLLSGLIALTIDPVPVADARYFTPTPWRFPS